MFLKDCWYVAGWSHEVAEGQPQTITIAGEPVVMYRRPGGAIAALEDRCVHRLAPLSLGRCEGDNLRCMYHGLLFDPDGVCVEIPGQPVIPAKARVRAYPAVERWGWIWIWMGAPERADEDLIPKSIPLDSPDWHFGSGQLDLRANYKLMSDNLTDFSHLSFVHENSFRAGLNWALSLPSITQLKRGILVERWVENDPKPPYIDIDGDLVDQYIRYEYLVPGILLLYTEIHHGGVAARYASFEGRPEPLFATFSPQAVTAIDEHSTRYFFAWGHRAVDGTADTASRMMEVARQAFAEDKLMIEAQQVIIDRDPSIPEMPIAADKGVTLYQRTMKSLLKAESNG